MDELAGSRRKIVSRENDSDEQCRSLIENTGDWVWETDPDFALTYNSPNMRDIMGYEREEVRGRTPFEFMPEDELERVKGIAWPAIARREPIRRFENRLIRKDGSVAIIETSGMPLFDERGRYRGYRGVNRDVTAQRGAEAALRANEKFLNNIFDGIQDGISVLDRDLNVIRVNQVMEQLYPHMKPLDGKKCYHVYHGRPEPCERCPSRRAIEQKTAQSEVVPFEGPGHELKGWQEIFAYPLIDDHGTVTGVIEHVRDVTDRRRAEESLQLMRYVIDQTQDEASLAGPDGRFVYVNDAKCRSLGYTREELLSLHVWDVDAEMSPEMWPALWEDLKKRGFKKVEAIHVTKGGRTFPSEIWTTYLAFHGNEYVCAFVRDVTERKRTEETLRRSETGLRKSQEIAHLGSWELDLVNDTLYWSDEVYKIFGLEPGEFGATYEAFLEVVHPDDRAAVDSAYRGSIREGRDNYEIEHRLVRKSDGEVRTVHEKCEHFRDGASRIVRSVGMVHDITDLRRAEESLKLTQFTMDRAGDVVLWVAPDSRFIYVNEAACRTFGYTRAEMLARTTFDTCPSWTRQTWAEHWREIKERGSFTIERPLRKKDGSYFPGEISVNYIAYEGKEYNCSLIRDITERKRAEEALHESERKFRFLAEATKAGIVLYRDRKFIYINSTMEKITGFSKDELMTKDFWEVVHPDDRELVRSRGFARQRGARVPATYEFQILTKGGAVRWVEISAAVIHYDGKKTVMATLFDVTDRKRAEAELQEAKAEAELYLDLMGHDIKNLNQISAGFLELASDTLELDEDAKELIARPLEAMAASTRLIENVRKLRKIKEGGLRFHAIDLGALIAGIVPRYANVPGRDVKINVIAGCPCQVAANDLLDDVFSNIIGNAIKHSRGPLTVDAHVNQVVVGDRKYCLVAIEDDGPGVPDALKGELFTRFHGRKGRPNGRGLGLYIVRTLVEDFGGRAWVEDRVQGDHTKGARFMILLPAVDPDSDKRS